MKNKLNSWPDFHHRINLIYHAIIAFSLVPFALVFLDIDSGLATTSKIDVDYEWAMIVVLLAAAGALCYLVWKNAKQKLANIDTSLSIKVRLAAYLKFQIRRYFQLEIAALIILAGLWLTVNYIFVIAYILVLVQFSLLRPSQDRVIRDMQFTKEERAKLSAPEL